MSYLLTKTDEGADISVHSDLVVIAEITKQKKLWFYCTTGTRSGLYMPLAAAKDWLSKNGIVFFHITENKIACKPHVLGRRNDSSLVYNPAFYYLLTEEDRKNFVYHSIHKTYYKALRKASQNEVYKKPNWAKQVDKKPITHSIKSTASENGKNNLSIKSLSSGRKKIVSDIKKKTSGKKKRAYRVSK
jgi:hypothetical protein